MKTYPFKDWPTLALIACIVIIIIVTSIFAFEGSNKVTANVATINQENDVGEQKSSDIDISSPAYTDKETPPSIEPEPKPKIEPQPTPTPAPEPEPEPEISNSPQEIERYSNYKEFFKDDVFLGDSISEGLFYYDFLDENRVIASKGLSIIRGIDEADKAIALNPNNVFILFGVNDIDDRTPTSWIIGHYTTLVEKLKTKLPNSQIYVLSILPVLESQVKNPHINNAHIQECNAGLKNMASYEDVKYINLGLLLNENNKNLYAGDGVHFKPDFYSLWLNYLESIIGKTPG